MQIQRRQRKRIPLVTTLILGLWALVVVDLDLVAGLDSIETASGNTGDRHGSNNQERVWGAAATESAGTKIPDETLPLPSEGEAKPVGGAPTNIDEKSRGWGGSSVPDAQKPYVVEDVLSEDVVEYVQRNSGAAIETEPPESDDANSSPEKIGGSKRVWGASESEATQTKPVEELAKKRNGSDSSSVRNKVASERKPEVEEGPREESKRHWGADHSHKGEGNSSESEPSGHIPFVASKHLHNPPEGFTLAARVYIGDDKLAHFDYDDDKRCGISLPYFDCGASGSTTAALPVKNAYFRHSLSAPTVWVDPDMHPVLAIALAPFSMELDSGEMLDLRSGDVILLEDSIRPGHRMIVSDNHNLSVLFVTLPQPHYHTGKQHLSLKKAVARKTAPCVERNGLDDFAGSTGSSVRPSLMWDARRIRLIVLGTVALSLSTLAADFLGKTAPLWLAVGVGGTCFVVGSTYGLTVAGDHVFNALELWRERRNLESQSSTILDVDESSGSYLGNFVEA